MSSLDSAFELIDRLVEGSLAYHGTPGLSMAVTDRDRTLRISTYGLSDISSGARVLPEMLFQIGSISKSFACIALMQLREEGKLDVNDPVAEYVPWFSVRSRYGPITLHHLMTHTAGIILGSDATLTAKSEVWSLRETETSAPPGTHFHYSNSGYKLLGLVLESVENEHGGKVLSKRVLEPLGMSSTESVITDGLRPRTATGHVSLLGDRPWKRTGPFVPAPWSESDTVDGSISSTPEDMAKYVRLLLNRGKTSGRKLLSEESFSMMTHPHTATEDGVHGISYGYGLSLETINGHQHVEHGGGMVGHHSSMQIDMTAGVGVVVMINGDGFPDKIAKYALSVVSAALQGEELPPPPVPPEPIPDAGAFAGVYGSDAGTISIEARDELLILKHGSAETLLEQRGEDTFLADHPDFDSFLMKFGRKDGDVVEIFHGPYWYINSRYEGSRVLNHPVEWEAYPGHYASHNPWLSNFKIVLRKGSLVFVPPTLDEEPMSPLPGGDFRVGKDPLSPERISFDMLMDGKAIRANLSGGLYYRKFTP